MEPNTTEDELPESPPEIAPSELKSAMSPEQALEALHRGELIEKTRIVGLRFKGEFTKPVRLRAVTLVKPVFEKVTFADDVAFEACTLDRPRIFRAAVFEKGLSLSGSTLIKADLREFTVRGLFRCDNAHARARSTSSRQSSRDGSASGRRTFKGGSSLARASSSAMPTSAASTPIRGSY